MNSILNSLSSSPIANVLLKDMSIDDYTYQLQSSLPAGTREKIQLDIPTVAFDKKVSVDIPKYGLLCGAVLKLNITIAKTGTSYVQMANNFLLLLKSAVLSAHSREICELSGITNFKNILEMDAASKEAIKGASLDVLSGLTGSATVLFDGTYNLYIPLMFPFFSKMNQYIDTEFAEPLNLSFTLDTASKLFVQQRSSVLNAGSSKLMLYYIQMSENDVRMRQNSVFSTEKPTSIMSLSSYPEVADVKSFTVTGASLVPTVSTIKLNTPNLLVSTTVIVRRTAGDTLLQHLEPIDTIEFKGNGKSLYLYNYEEFALENCIFAGKKGTYQMSQYNNSLDENVFTHYWAMSDSPDFFSGGVSAKNLSDFTCIVSFTPSVSAAATYSYTVEVVHQYVNIISYSGSSGKIGVSMAL